MTRMFGSNWWSYGARALVSALVIGAGLGCSTPRASQEAGVPARDPSANRSPSAPTQASVAKVVNDNKAMIKVCYQRALLKDHTLTDGRVEIVLAVGTSGRVKSVSIDGPAPFHTMDPCIKESVARWVFPVSYEGYDAGFSYIFRGND